MNADLIYNNGSPREKHLLNRAAVVRGHLLAIALLASISLTANRAPAQQSPDLDKYFRQYVGLKSRPGCSYTKWAAGDKGTPVPDAGRGLLVWCGFRSCRTREVRAVR